MAAGVCIAGGAAVAAAMLGSAGAPAARADDGSIPADIGLLNVAQADVLEGFSLTGHTDTVLPGVIDQLEVIQTPLLSSDNNFVSGFGEALFNGPDQNLADASETFLSASQALAADPTNITAFGEYATAGFQLDGSLFGLIPSTVIGKLTDQILGIDSAVPGAEVDVVSYASGAAATLAGSPSDVISQAITDLDQGAALLDAAPTTDLAATQLELLNVQEGLSTQIDPLLVQIGTTQDALAPGDQIFLADANEQFVSAAQSVLAAEQAFIAADQAGQLSSSGFLPADLAMLQADFGLVGADFNVLAADLLAAFDPNLDALIPTDLAIAFDPSALSDLLTSIGL